jgi:GNAT superfamily N-acetyltransferase
MRYDIFQKLQTLRAGNPLYFMNAYVLTPALRRILDLEDTEVVDAGDAAAVCYSDNGVRRALLFAKDAYAAAALFGRLRGKGQIILELIDSRDRIDGLTEIFTQSGWRHYERLFRMSCPKIRRQGCVSAEVEFAKPDDLPALHVTLYEMFDANVSHLPSERQLLDCIEKGAVTVIRDGEKIAAMDILQKKGIKRRYLYQGFVHPEYQGRKYMQSIYDFEYASCPEETVFSLWVVESNASIIHIHTKYGYTPDPGRYLAILSTK